MEGFEHILNWKLKQGSHPFPGKDGGTCINEAAIVATGFKYRPVRAAEDMPDCFSRPICRLAMRLNDEASDADRQRLLPYVTRLACADTPDVERRREAYIAAHAGHGISFLRGLEILEGALAIGRRAEELPADDVLGRLQTVQREATTPTSVPDTTVFTKIKSWLGLNPEPEPVD